jgi:hypothetical protein
MMQNDSQSVALGREEINGYDPRMLRQQSSSIASCALSASWTGQPDRPFS